MRWTRYATVLVPLVLGVPAVGPALADQADAARSPRGFGSQGYAWDRMTAEQAQVLKLTGDPVRGQETYRQCRGCHRADGAGRTDGAYPRLTGQHAVVIVKQITDTRAGIRVNPKMEPFSSEHAVTLQEIADLAVYLQQARTTQENGKGDAGAVPRGAALYDSRGCADCHGKRGQGDAAKVYPVIAAQHHLYLLREMEHVQEGSRGNSHPDMVKSLEGLSAADLQALASFMSHLPDPREAAR